MVARSSSPRWPVWTAPVGAAAAASGLSDASARGRVGWPVVGGWFVLVAVGVCVWVLAIWKGTPSGARDIAAPAADSAFILAFGITHLGEGSWYSTACWVAVPLLALVLVKRLWGIARAMWVPPHASVAPPGA